MTNSWPLLHTSSLRAFYRKQLGATQGAKNRWLASHQIVRARACVRACARACACYGGGEARVKLMRKTAVFLVVLPTNQVSQFRVPLQPGSQDMLVVSSVETEGEKRKLQDITNTASCCLYEGEIVTEKGRKILWKASWYNCWFDSSWKVFQGISWTNKVHERVLITFESMWSILNHYSSCQKLHEKDKRPSLHYSIFRDPLAVFLTYNPVFLPYLDEKQAWNLIIGVGVIGSAAGQVSQG